MSQEALKKAMEELDEVKDKMTEGTYLVMCNALRDKHNGTSGIKLVYPNAATIFELLFGPSVRRTEEQKEFQRLQYLTQDMESLPDWWGSELEIQRKAKIRKING